MVSLPAALTNGRAIKQITAFFFGSLAAQGMAALSGLMLARWMSIHDYALYSAMTIILGAMTILTRGGVNLGLVSLLGKTWPDRGRAAEILASALAERLIISLLVLPPLLAVAAWVFHRNGGSTTEVIILTVLLTFSWAADMGTRLYDQIINFARLAARVQSMDAGLQTLRLVLLVAVFYVGLMSSESALIVTILVAAMRIWPIQHWVRGALEHRKAQPVREDRLFIRQITRRQLPIDFFYCLQAQVVLFIIAYYGVAANTAEVGALSRIAQLLLPFQSLMQAYAVPHFSRTHKNVGQSFIVMSIIGAVPGIALFLVSLLIPSALLWLIGSNYAHLTTELTICTIGVAVNAAASSSWQLLNNRGWNRWGWVQVPVTIIWTIIAAKTLDLSTTSGVLWLQAGFAFGLFGSVIAELLSVARLGGLR